MKLLNQYLDPEDAAEAKSSLREAGIASLVEAMDPHSVQPSKSGATHVGLWVLLDDQLQDAIKVLEDPAHVPSRILTHREIDQLEGKAENRVEKLFEKGRPICCRTSTRRASSRTKPSNSRFTPPPQRVG